MTVQEIPPGIEVIPGWELVRVGHPVVGVDWVVGFHGNPILFDGNPNINAGSNWVIICKIEKPKRYRPFANAAEAELFWDAKLRVKGDDGSRSRVTSLRSHGCRIGADYHSYADAFHIFECVDGTPFGIEVT